MLTANNHYGTDGGVVALEALKNIAVLSTDGQYVRQELQ